MIKVGFIRTVAAVAAIAMAQSVIAAPAQSDSLRKASGIDESSRGGVIYMDGSFLRPLHKRDSILIGDQLSYGFRIDNVTEGTAFLLPDYSRGLADSVEVVSNWRLDTLKVTRSRSRKLRLYNIEGSVRITSFDEGEYVLPPVAVLRTLTDGTADTLVFNEQRLTVKSTPVDTLTFVPHDIKPQIRYPLTFAEILPYLAGFYAFAITAILVWALTEIRKKRKTAAGKNAEPAHITALRKLDHFKGNKYWSPEKQKYFYSGITDALREYIAARYGVGAMEMTTSEIFDELKGRDIPADLYEVAREMFESSDYVKFAKMTVSEEDIAGVLPAAVRFVTSTYESSLSEDTDKKEE